MNVALGCSSTVQKENKNNSSQNLKRVLGIRLRCEFPRKHVFTIIQQDKSIGPDLYSFCYLAFETNLFGHFCKII